MSSQWSPNKEKPAQSGQAFSYPHIILSLNFRI
jgi:hypothetical protein